MAKNPETIIQDAIRKWLDDNKIYCERDTSGNNYGGSDLRVCYRGFWVALEVKTEIGIKTSIQERKIKSIKRAGGFGGFVTCVEDVRFILNDIDDFYSQLEDMERFCEQYQ